MIKIENLCKNCKSFKGGICEERNAKTELDQTCSLFEERNISKEIKECYLTIIDILKKFCDLEERYYPIIALWIIGTYAHDEFETYPYLFLNATKGSGKSRLLRLISVLSKNGRVIGSLTEAVLFRTAKGRTFCIDECEGIGSKEKSNLRELLNSAYKKGLVIERIKEKKVLGETIREPETFEVYTPVAMANIYGMEEVLGDRCINLILEKSTNPKITKKIENFDKDFAIQQIKKLLGEIENNLCSLILEKDISKDWNDFIEGTLSLDSFDEKTILFFKKVDETQIEGRNLELLFALYFLADLIDDETLKKMLEISQEIVKEREEEDFAENRDKILIRFLASKEEQDLEYFDYINTTEVATKFKAYLGEGNDWINARWIGKALKRMKLLKDKIRKTGGIKVLINIEKAKKRM